MKGKLFISFVLVSLLGCYPDEDLNVDINNQDVDLTALDQYIQENFTDPYGMVIRYRFSDQFLTPGQTSVPPSLEVVPEMLDFIEDFWIEPFIEVNNGTEFFSQNVPSEIILIGGFIIDASGNRLLGVADAGARITFTEINRLDRNDDSWVLLQLGTVYHEFAHVVHQRFGFPQGFEDVSPAGYTSPGSWFNLTGDEALRRGFVSPYATNQVSDDYAELIAFYLYDQDFFETYVEDETNCITPECEERNAGRQRIREKLSLVLDHYEQVTNVKLEDVRNAVQQKLE